MTKYDESFEPPAPTAEIIIKNSENGRKISNIPMLLDTGADVSLLPLTKLQELGIKPLENEFYQLQGFQGGEFTAEVFYLQVVFCRKQFSGKYCATDDEIGILGRDVLNQTSLLFNGLNLTWQEIIEETQEI